jgi:uncharacterized protein (TIGR03437 family)
MRHSTLLRLTILSGLLVADAVAQSPGKFVTTGSMTALRTNHTATLLKDGRVLITGGEGVDVRGKGTFLASAELYDPSTGAFTPTGDMTTSRFWHTATLLADGRVLIAGGLPEANSFPSSSELYDPATGLFTRSAEMTGKHFFHLANLLNNGKVLITGYSGAELYDPASGAFTRIGDMGYVNNTVVLPDGRVVVAGWGDGDVSLYEVTSDSLKLVASLSKTKYFDQTATLLADGRVLIAGGDFSTYEDVKDEALLYDSRRGTLEATGHLLSPRGGQTATLLPGGHVLIVGGYDGSYLSGAEEYDPFTGTFTDAATTNWARDGHTTTLLDDGRVLVVGGMFDTTIAELYIPKLRAASAASLKGPLAPESLASLFGSRMTVATENADPLSPPTSLGGISLRVTDSSGAARLAPLLYVSPSQINFEVPAGTAPGNVALEVLNASAQSSKTAAQVNPIAPGLFAYEDNTVIAYALRFEPNGKQTVLSIRDTISLDDRPVYLVLYATGIRNRSSQANVQCTIGGISLPVEYAGPEGSGISGLDQVNVRLTSDLKGRGLADLALTVDGIPSNTVAVVIR